jgi:hypothetical protein
MYCLQGAAKVSILMIGQQAIMDAYLCLLHLTAGILVGESYDLNNLFVLPLLHEVIVDLYYHFILWVFKILF